jgi:hypothetical protein
LKCLNLSHTDTPLEERLSPEDYDKELSRLEKQAKFIIDKFEGESGDSKGSDQSVVRAPGELQIESMFKDEWVEQRKSAKGKEPEKKSSEIGRKAEVKEEGMIVDSS